MRFSRLRFRLCRTSRFAPRSSNEMNCAVRVRDGPDRVLRAANEAEQPRVVAPPDLHGAIEPVERRARVVDGRQQRWMGARCWSSLWNARRIDEPTDRPFANLRLDFLDCDSRAPP